MQFLLIILSDSSWGWVTLYWTTNGNNIRSPKLLSGWSLHQFRRRTQLWLAKVAAAGSRREIVKLFWREKRVILLLLFLIRPGTDWARTVWTRRGGARRQKVDCRDC